MCQHDPIGGGEWWRRMRTTRKPSAKLYDRKKQPQPVEGIHETE